MSVSRKTNRWWFRANVLVSLVIGCVVLYHNASFVSNRQQRLGMRLKFEYSESDHHYIKKVNGTGDTGSGWRLIRQYTSCLTAESSSPLSIILQPSSYIHLKRCDPSNSLQLWKYNPSTLQIIAKRTDENGYLMCLDAYGLKKHGYIGGVQLYKCKSGQSKSLRNQQWDVMPQTTPKEKLHGMIVSKLKGYGKNSKVCLTTRSKASLGDSAWFKYFSNRPQEFLDHGGPDDDFVAVRQCANNYRFFYTRMQRWRLPNPHLTEKQEHEEHVHTHTHATHDGITILLTVPSIKNGELLAEHVHQLYPNIPIVVVAEVLGTKVLDAPAQTKLLSLDELESGDGSTLHKHIQTPYVLVLGSSNRLMPDFDLYTLIETLNDNPTALGATGFVQDKYNNLFRPCYTAIKVPVSELSKEDEAQKERMKHIMQRTELRATKSDLIQLAQYRKRAKQKSGGTGVLPKREKDTEHEAPRESHQAIYRPNQGVSSAQAKLPLTPSNNGRRSLLASDDVDSEFTKRWVEGYFEVSGKMAMSCDRGAKPVMVRKADLRAIILEEIGARAQKGKGEGGKHPWEPLELVSGMVVAGTGERPTMRRIAVNPAFRSTSSAYKCTRKNESNTPSVDCFAVPAKDMNAIPLAIEDVWRDDSPCHKVGGTDQKRGKFRGFSEALDVFGRSIHEFKYYFMDGSLLALIKLGTFAPWDSDLDVMMQMPSFFPEYNNFEMQVFALHMYKALFHMQLSVEEKKKRKDGKYLAWINPTTFHLYIPMGKTTPAWISSWHSVCEKNKDYTLNEPWETCLEKLKKEKLIYSRGYNATTLQTDLHFSFPHATYGKDTRMAPRLRVADKDYFHFVPYHYIETVYWWYDKDLYLRNPWDCSWKYELFYPPYKTTPYT